MEYMYISVQFSSVAQCVRLFATPWIAARQASLSITNSQSSLKLMSIELLMPSSHLIKHSIFLYIYTGLFFFPPVRSLHIQELHLMLLFSCSVCPSLLWPPWTATRQAPLSMGFPRQRILEWVAIFFSRESSRPRDWTHIFCLAGGFFTTEPPGKPKSSIRGEHTTFLYERKALRNHYMVRLLFI